MKVYISALDSEDYDVEIDVSQLHYSRQDNNFWMPCVMADDWLQRVNSSHTLKAEPSIVKIKKNISFVVFNESNDAKKFHVWLKDAETKVQDGYRNMRG